MDKRDPITGKKICQLPVVNVHMPHFSSDAVLVKSNHTTPWSIFLFRPEDDRKKRILGQRNQIRAQKWSEHHPAPVWCQLVWQWLNNQNDKKSSYEICQSGGCQAGMDSRNLLLRILKGCQKILWRPVKKRLLYQLLPDCHHNSRVIMDNHVVKAANADQSGLSSFSSLIGNFLDRTICIIVSWNSLS